MLRVLIADNRQTTAEYMAETLANHGFHATAVYSGQKAVELAAVLRPDVLVCEALMPEMTGIEAGILIRLMLPSCRVILFAEHGLTKELFERARLQGHQFETLEKPFEPKILLTSLGTADSKAATRGVRDLNRS
jgi:CheY-like chemotaxis protein